MSTLLKTDSIGIWQFGPKKNFSLLAMKTLQNHCIF